MTVEIEDDKTGLKLFLEKEFEKRIEETDNYFLSIITTNISPIEKTYGVINKQYEVVEAETKLLPQALKYLLELEAGLAAMRDVFKDKDTTFKLALADNKKKEGRH